MFAVLRQWAELQEVAVFDPRSAARIDPRTFYFSGGIVNGAWHTQAGGVGMAPGGRLRPHHRPVPHTPQPCTVLAPASLRVAGALCDARLLVVAQMRL
jgi:hypothetical protein